MIVQVAHGIQVKAEVGQRVHQVKVTPPCFRLGRQPVRCKARATLVLNLASLHAPLSSLPTHALNTMLSGLDAVLYNVFPTCHFFNYLEQTG